MKGFEKGALSIEDLKPKRFRLVIRPGGTQGFINDKEVSGSVFRAAFQQEYQKAKKHEGLKFIVRRT